MHMEKISVIVPVYNTEKYLSRCVESILLQTYKNLEIILVDDGSTDKSGEICENYRAKDERIVVIHKKNGGQADARNAGLEVVTGDYIAFVDSDDWLEKDIYEYCINLFKVTNCDIVDYQCVFSDGKSPTKTYIKGYKIEIIEGKEILRDYLYRGQTEKAPFSVCRKLYKRSLFEKIRFPEGKVNEDIVTNFRVLMKCNRIVHTNKIGYYYFQGGISTSRGGLKKKDFDLINASEELVSLTENEYYKDIKYLAKVKLARSYFSLLAKIAFYGIDEEDLEKKEIIKCLTEKLRENYSLLIKSPMPLNRKIMVTALCINFSFLSLPLKVYKKMLNIIRK